MRSVRVNAMPRDELHHRYDPKTVEAEVQENWRREGLYQAVDFDSRPKQYVLVEFPYPSGEGLHVGHCLSYVAQDSIARWKRMRGYNVLYPIGWDAFGLPTENFAIKNKVKPQDATKKNIANFKRQIQNLGISFDWSREVNTADPAYYRWTQWIFLQLFKHGLAEKKEVPINWCPKDKIGLAFEEVIDGKCERCGTQTERRTIRQWVLKITQYADRLIDDLEKVDFLPEIKQQQINWIGRSEGAEVEFKIKNPESRSENLESSIKVFTTRPDTLFGATYLVLSPEHGLIKKLESRIENLEELRNYIAKASSKTDRERQESKEKTGVGLKGVKAINPVNKEEIPVWIADYVLGSYGTGAIMAVPAHDVRDNEFAKKFHLPLIKVIEPASLEFIPNAQALEAQAVPVMHLEYDCWIGEGKLVNSGKFSGMSSEKARDAITKFAKGEKTVQYKLHDWIFSRQHYWGEPIPIVICEKCGYVPLDEKDLPLELPDVDYYEPTDTGESPLAKIDSWVSVNCPKCGNPAKRETDTMPNWAGSSWYFLRYADPKNDARIADQKKLTYWLPVDLYNGGAEHTTLHLLYSRFWHKFLYDIKVVPTSEPYQRRVQHGFILAPDGQKMSKSRGNVINPDDIMNKFGADTFRLYILFMGEYDQTKHWNDDGVAGAWRFMKRVWEFSHRVSVVVDATDDELAVLNRTIKLIDADLGRRSFNTIVSHLMIMLNDLQKKSTIGRNVLENMMRLLAPFAPHAADAIWRKVLGHNNSIHTEGWPEADAARSEDKHRIGVQINGRRRGEITVTDLMSAAEVEAVVVALPELQKYLNGKKPKKFIYVKSRIVSIIV